MLRSNNRWLVGLALILMEAIMINLNQEDCLHHHKTMLLIMVLGLILVSRMDPVIIVDKRRMGNG